MSSCCSVHKELLSEFPFSVYSLSDYQEHNQNIRFLIINETLLIIDSTKFIKNCPRCDRERNLYIYGHWPDVRASFDGATDLPICAIVHGIKKFVNYTKIYDEPSFGKFIYLWLVEILGSDMIIYTHGNIEYKSHKSYQNISINGIPVICCQTMDDKYILIDINGIITQPEFVLVSRDLNINVGSGTLNYISENDTWEYTANQPLKTKAAIHK
jgi:hypothetical protein